MLLVSYVAYIWQMFWPVRLAAFYPHPNDQLALWQVLLAIAFLITISPTGNSLEEETTVHFHWLVLVCRNACAGHRPGAGRRASARGSIHLSAEIGLYVLIVWGITDLITSIMTRRSHAIVDQRLARQSSITRSSSRWPSRLVGASATQPGPCL